MIVEQPCIRALMTGANLTGPPPTMAIDDHRVLIDRLGDALLAGIDRFKRLLTADQGKSHDDAAYAVVGTGR